MNIDRDLPTGEDRAPPGLRERIAIGVSRTEQRPAWRAWLAGWQVEGGPWRAVALASTIAAAVVVTIVALGLLDRPGAVGGDPSPSPEPSAAPTIGSELPPGEFSPAEFQPVVSIQLDDGWNLERHSTDTVQLEAELDGDLLTLGIHRPGGVADPVDETRLPLPDDLTAWIDAHPALAVTERREERVSGVTMTRFTTESLFVANDATGASLAFLILGEARLNLEPGIAYEIAVFTVDDQPVVVIGSVPVRRAIELTERMDALMPTIRFERP